METRQVDYEVQIYSYQHIYLTEAFTKFWVLYNSKSSAFPHHIEWQYTQVQAKSKLEWTEYDISLKYHTALPYESNSVFFNTESSF